LPTAVALHARFDVPGAGTICGVKLHVKPVDGLIIELKLTVPLNPLTEPMVIVEWPVALMSMLTVVGLALMVKSGVATVTVLLVPWLPLWTPSVDM